MTEVVSTQQDWLKTADPTTTIYWAGARENRLLIQHCPRCRHHQFYPRPFCLACGSRSMEWREASGRGHIYSMTTVRIPVLNGLVPPYVLALVELEEGPRLLTNVVGGDCGIGDSVEGCWADRNGLPVPLFAKPGSEPQYVAQQTQTPTMNEATR